MNVNSIKNEKILNFNAMVGNNNNNIAIEFLNLANWDESEAVKLYLDNVNVPDIQTIPTKPDTQTMPFKYIKECFFAPEDTKLKIISFFKTAFKKDNSKLCSEFYGKIRGLVTSGENFINLLKINKGVIIIYNLATKNRLFEQLDMINRAQPNDYLNCSIIYPIINDSAEGDALIEQLSINRFPCYLFCKYKNDKIFYVVDKMEGIFYLDLFKSSLSPEIKKTFNSNINLQQNKNNNNFSNISNNQNNYNSSINLNNNHKLPNQNSNFSVNKNDIKNAQNNYNYNFSRNNPENKNLNNYQNNNKENNLPKHNNQNFIKFNNNNNVNSNNYNLHFPNGNNNNNNYSSLNERENSDLPSPLNVYKFNNNNNLLQNNNNHDNNNNFQSYKNNNSNKSESDYNKNNNNKISQKNNNILQNNDNNKIKEDKKEYIPDYRDYAFEDELVYNPVLDKYEKMSNVIQNLDKNDNVDNNNKFFERNIPMSDKEIRQNQDEEMRELERIEEEKQKKIKEEMEKQKKLEEEEKERLKNEAEEKELFSSLIPPEPDDSNPDKCVIIFRMPDGEKNIQRKFLKTEKISVLYDYVKSLGKEIYSDEEYTNFSIIQTFPFKNFEDKLNNTLEEEGLFPNSLLQIKLTN